MVCINLLRLYNTVRSNFKKAGLYIDETKILEVKFSNISNYRLGQFNILKNDIYSVEISCYLNHPELIDIVELTLYHELCHFLQVQELLTNHYMQIDESGNLTYNYTDSSFIKETLESNNGHTHLWRTFADIISNRFGIELTETVCDEIFERIIDANNLNVEELESLKESNTIKADELITLSFNAFIDYFKEDLNSTKMQILKMKYL